MYVAVVQMDPLLGALRENAEHALACIEELAARPYPPDLVIFPAFALCGAPLEGLAHSTAFAAEALTVSRDFMARAPLPTLIGSVLPRPYAGPSESMTFVCEPEVLFCHDGRGGALGFVDFMDTWEGGAYGGSINLVIEGLTVAVFVDGYPEMGEDLSNVDLIVMLLAKSYRGPDESFTSSTQIKVLRNLARRANAYLVVANLAGAQDGEVFDGASLILDPFGTVLATAEPFIEQIIEGNCLPSSLAAPAAHPLIVRPMLPSEADWRALKAALGAFVEKNALNGVLLEVKGDLASSLLLDLSVQTLGAKRVRALLLPGPNRDTEALAAAAAFAQALDVRLQSLDMSALLQSFPHRAGSSHSDGPSSGRPAHVAEPSAPDERPNLAEPSAPDERPLSAAKARLMERLRGTCLLDEAEAHNRLLLSSVDKTALALGMATSFGDVAAPFAPFATLYRSDIHRLIEWRIDQKVEAWRTLFAVMKDEDELRALARIDRILHLHIEEGMGIDQIREHVSNDPGDTAPNSAFVAKLLESVRQAELGRRQTPISPFLGPNDLYLDRAWPVTNGFVDHAESAAAGDELFEYLGLLQGRHRPDDWTFMSN
ncbi:MAG: hypothetical protein LBO07_02950 [Coriobacteriales bacterium]|jgi:NH3-dependent NAD+ synthetase/predicted amidohydrolase|nr:hypothetical protein [Coriobacteriales bacterium]